MAFIPNIENTGDPNVQPGGEGGATAGDVLSDKPGGGLSLAALFKLLGFGDPERGKKVAGVLGSTAVSALLNKKSGATKTAEQNLARASAAEAAALEQRTQLINNLVKFLTTGEGLGQVRTGPVFQFTDDAGGAALDKGFLEQLQPGIARRQQLNMLLGAAGLSPGTQNVGLSGQLAAQDERLRQQSIASTVGALIQALLFNDAAKDAQKGE